MTLDLLMKIFITLFFVSVVGMIAALIVGLWTVKP